MELISTHPVKKSDLGFHGNLFGGKLLAWVDAAGAAYASQVCDTPRMVTILIDKCVFQKPAKEGHLLKIYGSVEKFGNTSVKQIMTSRVDVVSIDLSSTYDEILKKILESGYSRIPVCEDSLDQVKGVLYIKDLLPYLTTPKLSWKKLVRPAFFVPENKKIDDLLKEFQEIMADMLM